MYYPFISGMLATLVIEALIVIMMIIVTFVEQIIKDFKSSSKQKTEPKEVNINEFHLFDK